MKKLLLLTLSILVLNAEVNINDKASLHHGIAVEKSEITNYVPATNTIDLIKLKLTKNSTISNFPCSKDDDVEILADGMLSFCILSKEITIKDITIVKGSHVKLLNGNKGAHPTFEMVNQQNYGTKKEFVPIWVIGGKKLKEDASISGIDCLKGSLVEIVDNGKLVECNDTKSVVLEGYKLKKGCTVSNLNALQSKQNLLDVWDFSCAAVKLGDTTLSVLNIRYFPHKDKIEKISGFIDYKEKHTLEDLLKGKDVDLH